MSLRIAAASFALLAAACAAGGCSGHAAHRTTAGAASALPSADLARGKALYEAQCAACHGERGVGGPVGPSLHNENARHSYHWVYALVLDPPPPMPKLYPSRMTKNEVRDVSAYVETL